MQIKRNYAVDVSIRLDQGTVQCRTLEDAARNHRVCINTGNISTKWAVISFS